MPRKKKASVVPFIGKKETFIKNAENLMNTGDGVLAAYFPEDDSMPVWVHNFHGSTKKYRRFIADWLDGLQDEILEEDG